MSEIHAETIFMGGDIVTMNEARPEAEALAAGRGKIMAVGTRDEVLDLRGPETRVVDLAGKTLMPGLIEPHSHPIISALLYDWLDVSGFNNPSGAEVMEKLRRAAAEAEPGQWISAFGYDPILTRDLKAPSAELLDGISLDNPVVVMIQSMHTVFVNHKAFELAGLTDSTPQPEGGTLVKDEAGRLTGMVIEQGAITPILAALFRDSRIDGRALLQKQMGRYARAGYTTVGAPGIFPMFPESMTLLKEMVEGDDCPVRLVIMHTSGDLESGRVEDLGPDSGRLRTGGAKLWYDGSPYTGNMFLDEPFLNSELMQQGLGIPENTCGYAMMPKERLLDLVRKYHDQGRQIAIHAQGDRAVRDVVDVYEAVLKASPRGDHRHRIEHGALFPPDQLGRAARLGLTPSWHINHIYYYGEALRDEIIGPERTKVFMPIFDAQKHGLRSSLHNDSPMYPAEPFKLMRTAVTRKTRKGALIGADQAVTVDEAIKALTINPAWQMFLENVLGSLEPGKLADLVVLSENPRKIEPDSLDQIQVLETYRGGLGASLSGWA